jgi:hypothetical protein
MRYYPRTHSFHYRSVTVFCILSRPKIRFCYRRGFICILHSSSGPLLLLYFISFHVLLTHTYSTGFLFLLTIHILTNASLCGKCIQLDILQRYDMTFQNTKLIGIFTKNKFTYFSKQCSKP